MRTEHVVIPFAIKRATVDTATRTFEGYGSVFGGVDSYKDTIAKGAYQATLKEWKALGKLPKMLLQHGGGFFGSAEDLIPVGKWEDMHEDDHGLFVKGRMFDVATPRVIETYAALKEGELDGLSIGYRARKYEIDEETGIRTLTDIELREVSIVTFPADTDARIEKVKAGEEIPTEREFERWLRREAGFTEQQAKTIIAKGYRQVRREAMPSDDPSELLALLNQRRAIVTGAQTS